MKKKEPICPLLKKACIQHECTFFVHITGANPQTGAQMDLFDCAIKWTPVMMLDASKNMRGVQAAVEGARNDICERQDNLNNALIMGAKMMEARRAPPSLPADVVSNPLLEG